MRFTNAHGGATIERPGGTDQYGNPLPGETQRIEASFVAPAGSTEWTSNRMTTETKFDWYLPPFTEIQEWDTVEFDDGPFAWSGERCQVEGRPADWSVHPSTNSEFGVVALLKSPRG